MIMCRLNSTSYGRNRSVGHEYPVDHGQENKGPVQPDGRARDQPETGMDEPVESNRIMPRCPRRPSVNDGRGKGRPTEFRKTFPDHHMRGPQKNNGEKGKMETDPRPYRSGRCSGTSAYPWNEGKDDDAFRVLSTPPVLLPALQLGPGAIPANRTRTSR